MEKNFVTSLTAQNATETTKTEIDTYTVPQGASKLVEIGTQIKSAGLTTLEDLSHILEIESDNAQNWTTQQFASDSLIALTSGSAVMPSRKHSCDIPVKPGDVLKFSTTFNMALTINPSVRIFGKFK